MYFYDPEQGKRRRAMLADQFSKFQNNGQDFFAAAKRDLQNRREGMRSEPITGGLEGLSGEWTPGVRLIAALAGGGLAFYGLAKSGLGGVGATLIGLNLVSRSIFSNRSMSGMAGMPMSGAGEEMSTQSEQTKNASSGTRHSDGQPRGKQRSGANASSVSEQGEYTAQQGDGEPATRTPMGGDIERDLDDENVGFDNMLPGNLPEGAGQ
jgi:hypothetical protein